MSESESSVKRATRLEESKFEGGMYSFFEHHDESRTKDLTLWVDSKLGRRDGQYYLDPKIIDCEPFTQTELEEDMAEDDMARTTYNARVTRDGTLTLPTDGTNIEMPRVVSILNKTDMWGAKYSYMCIASQNRQAFKDFLAGTTDDELDDVMQIITALKPGNTEQ